MKITKKQLKQIIAEEHALVYGTRKPSRKKVNRSKRTLEERKYLRARKQQLLKEARDQLWAEEILVEGLWSRLFGGIKDTFAADDGVAGGIKKAYKATKTAAQQSLDSFVDGMDNVKNKEQAEAVGKCVAGVAKVVAQARDSAVQDAVSLLSAEYDKEEAQTWATMVVNTLWANSEDLEKAESELMSKVKDMQAEKQSAKEEKRAARDSEE